MLFSSRIGTRVIRLFQQKIYTGIVNLRKLYQYIYGYGIRAVFISRICAATDMEHIGYMLLRPILVLAQIFESFENHAITEAIIFDIYSGIDF